MVAEVPFPDLSNPHDTGVAAGKTVPLQTELAIRETYDPWARGIGIPKLLERVTDLEPGVLVVDPQWGHPGTALKVHRERFPHLTFRLLSPVWWGDPVARAREMEADNLYYVLDMRYTGDRPRVDAILRECWEAGVVLAGLSAGMICWYECSVTDSFGPLAALKDGLGFLPGSACPHYDGEAEREPTYRRLITGGFPAGVAADDGAGLAYRGTRLVECVSSRERARAFRVFEKDGAAVEEPLEVRYLG